MKKICFLVNKYDPVVGGTELLCKSIVENLLVQYSVSIITSPSAERNKENYKYNIYDCNWQHFSLMKEHFEIFDYDLVVFFADLHSPFLNIYDYKWAKKNICILNIDERTYEYRDNFLNATNNLKNFNNVVTFCKDSVVNKFLQDNQIKNIYINNFSRDIQQSKFDINFIEKLKLNKKNKTIFYNAAYEDRKNQLNVLKCISQSSYLKQFNYIFLGAQASENYLAECISFQKNNNLENIRFLNATSDLNKVDALYQQVDFVLLASIAEGMPLVLLEAMSANKPFISSDVGGVKGVLRDVCDIELLNFNFSSSELEQKIKKQINKNINYRDIWKNNFDKEQAIKKYTHMIEEILI